ncbi:multidrug effflux MFS transporter [Croceicoccus mobilis]|uniref:Bcr/CflA family efflux transporter n=1 Tax=Croceicoccus mobilis TaxID=1703339 RepID=A0A916Z1V3_9SPHN|nr:multidrug effflux MFS transporter [Croceicoccus mobilis]GGD72015.1 Bcr/CflA family drug resistance efflux transporter [Croceicoccus mobilis]
MTDTNEPATTRQGTFGAALMIGVLALLSIFPPLATDMYLSAMDDLARALNASASATEMSLSIFFFGLCIGQFIIGPLIDAHGRKLPLLAGTMLFCMTSLGLLLVRDVTIFNALRLFQAIGACAGMVVGRAIIADIYRGRKAAQVLTILVMLMTLGPILAPFLGSLLLAAFGWQSIFVCMLAVGIAALFLSMALIPETLPRSDRQPGAMRKAAGTFARLARTPVFILPALTVGFVQAPMFAFITGSSGIFQGVFGLSATEYGILFGVIASALVVFGQLNSMLLKRFDADQLLNRGLPVFAACAALLVTAALSGDFWLIVVPLWFTLGMVGLLTANAMDAAMRAAPAAGIGSAAIGALQFGFAFLTSTLVALLGTDSAMPMVLVILAASVLANAAWLRLRGLNRSAAGPRGSGALHVSAGE